MTTSFLKLAAFPCLLLTLLGIAGSIQAQVYRPSQELNQSIASQADRLFKNNINASPTTIQAGTFTLEELQAFLHTQLFQTETLKDNWYESRIGQLKRMTGLNLTANYQHNEYGAFYENFENDSRFRAGLDFDLLENGLIERRSEMKRLKKDQEIHRLESLMSSRERDYAFLYNCLIYRFNLEKINLLNQRVPFLQEYIRLLYELYFAHEMSYDEIIDQKSRLKEAEIMLAAAHQFNSALEKEIGKENIAPLHTPQLPVVQIDIEKLLDPGDLNVYQENVKQLKNERIDLSYRKRIDAKVKLYSRYNYGSYQGGDNERAFTSFGISLQAPIQFNRKTAAELSGFEKAMIEEDISEVWYNRVKEIMILYEEYQYKLKQYSNFLHKTFHIQEKMRVEKVLLDSKRDVHSPMKSIKHIDNKRAVEYELLHLKQQLYLLILKIHLRSFQQNFTRCLEPLDFSKDNQKLRGQRFVLLNPLRDNRLDPEYLIKYLQKNEINNVMLEGANSQVNQWAEILHSEGFNLFCAAEQQLGNGTAMQTNFSGNFRKMSYSGQLLVSSYQQNAAIPASQFQLTTIPDKIFKSRNELERWIELENKTGGVQYFLFEDIKRIMELDMQNLGVE